MYVFVFTMVSLQLVVHCKSISIENVNDSIKTGSRTLIYKTIIYISLPVGFWTRLEFLIKEKKNCLFQYRVEETTRPVRSLVTVTLSTAFGRETPTFYSFDFYVSSVLCRGNTVPVKSLHTWSYPFKTFSWAWVIPNGPLGLNPEHV